VIEGAKTSLRLLREHWPALLALLVIFRVGYEVLTLWNAVPGWPERSYQVWGAWLPMAWRLVVVAGDALLGLWLAHAFMELARAPVEASTQA
jgi:hypothetical protein